MSTHSFICKESDGKIIAIYCHFDGYYDGVGSVLKDNYREREKIERLLANGDISGLEETPEKCRVYEDTELRCFDSRSDLLLAANDLCIEYVYLFTANSKWIWIEVFNDNQRWLELE